MKDRRRNCFAVFTAMTLLLVTHLPAGAQDVLNACAGDVKQYCSQVTLGDGRLLACLYAHEDKISDGCDTAVAETADQLDWFLSRVRTALETCAPDIEKHCAGVEAGQGRIYACLKLKQSELTEACNGVVKTVSQRLTGK